MEIRNVIHNIFEGKKINTDQAYLNAVKSRNIESAQEIINSVAFSLGYSGVYYHGTNSNYTQFDMSKTASQTGNPNTQLGFFFTKDLKEATRYSKDFGKKGGGRVISVMLKIEHPYEMPYAEIESLAMSEFKGLQNLNVEYDNTGNIKPEYKEIIKRNRDRARLESKQRREQLISEGYDGIIAKPGLKTEETIAFYPNQIKLADPITYDDEGKIIPLSKRFNSKEPDIRY